ncbi:MAG: glycosyltransferase [bacterium]|nr:glycosyltransferase [bacterium]
MNMNSTKRLNLNILMENDLTAGIPVILLTTDSTLCGTERMVLALARSLNRSKYQPVIVCMKGTGELIDAARAGGIDAYNLDMQDGALSGLLRWRALFRDRRPKIIHSFLFHSNLLARMTKLRHPGVRVIAGIRTVYTREAYGAFYARAERATHWLDSLYAANSEQGRLSAERNIGLAPSKLRVVVNGVEPARFDAPHEEIRRTARAEFGFSDDDLVAGVVAQLRPAKRHDLLLDAAARLKDEFAGLKLLIVGKDEGDGREQALREQAERLGLGDRVTFSGYRADARRLLRGMDLFVLPSSVEGIPVSVMEAMEAGLPAIATRVGGVPDVIEDGVSGAIIEPENIDALTEAMRRLLADAGLRERMGAAARERIASHFSVDAMARKFEALYAEALGAR